MPEDSSGQDWQEAFREAGPYVGLGMEIALSMILCVGGGYLLDRWWGTMPWGTLGGALLGVTVVVYQVVHASRTLSQKKKYGSPRSSEQEES